MRNRLGPVATLEKMRSQLPSLAESLPELAHHALQQLRRGEGPGRLPRHELEALREEIRESGRRNRLMLASLGLGLGAVALPASAPTSLLAGLGLAALGCAWRAFRGR